MRTLGLSLINIALERGGNEVAKCPVLLEVVQDEICKALLLNARTESLLLLSVTLRCVFNLFVYLKQHLKVQLEVFFNSIHLRLVEVGSCFWPSLHLKNCDCFCYFECPTISVRRLVFLLRISRLVCALV